MNGKGKNHGLTLTIFYSAVVFFVQFASIAVAGTVVYIFVRNGFVIREDDLTLGGAIMFMVIVSLCLGVILTLVSSKISLSPVNKLIHQMNRLASGDFDARLKFSGPLSKTAMAREITGGFNKMAEELQNTEMLRADFINNFSHEFKTPIVSIAGFAKLLKKGVLSEEKTREYLDIIEEEALRLSYMATNVLNMTEVENQAILTDVAEFNVSEQVRSCILLLERKWAEKDIGFHIDIDEHIVSASEELLKQVWINLLDNAIKFSPRAGVIDVTIKEDGKRLEAVITNSGPAIVKEKQKRIFDKFYQADESHSTEGSGIGLAVVKRIVELHGGSVSVCSSAEETTFTVSLPKQFE